MSKKVLVTDDSPVDQASIKNILTEAGFMVVTASNGTEAIAKAKSDKPAIIFLDVVMPGMDGYETCRTLQADPETKEIPVIFVTSKGQKADKVWGQMQGAKGHVQMPATADEIIDQIKALG
ncbi:MAG: response regulator [Betaproteobacteria bacterium]|nr:response regulator [Betaproteobacteria bacterium]